MEIIYNQEGRQHEAGQQPPLLIINSHRSVIHNQITQYETDGKIKIPDSEIDALDKRVHMNTPL